jgi:hypothetical protein
VHALTQNPIAYGAPHALEGGVPGVFSEFDGGLELIYTLRDPRVKVPLRAPDPLARLA